MVRTGRVVRTRIGTTVRDCTCAWCGRTVTVEYTQETDQIVLTHATPYCHQAYSLLCGPVPRLMTPECRVLSRTAVLRDGEMARFLTDIQVYRAGL